MKTLIRRSLSYIYRRLAPPGVRNLIASNLILTAPDRRPEAITRFDDGPVLVVAPHFDDEICGCGGVMGHHVNAGQVVSVVFVTDGAAGDPDLRAADLDGDARRAAQRKLSALREAESRAACGEYAITDITLLNGPDGQLAPSDALVRALGAVLDRVRPAIIYHPSLMDAHADHWNSNLILAAALATRKDLSRSVRLRGYEVWTPAIPNRFADIDAEMARKLRAFAHFASQNRTVDYPRAIGGLNAYRSIYLQGGSGYSEAFQELSVSEFETLKTAILARSRDDHTDT